MYSWIAEIINSLTGFITGFSKLNKVTFHSIKIFLCIMLVGVITFFLIKLCTIEELYNKFLNMNPLVVAFIIGIIVIAYEDYSHKRTMSTLLEALKKEKEKEKEYNEKIYEQTSTIENEARAMTKSLLTSLNADISTVEMLHNKDIFDSGVHCRYYDECYCSTRDGVYFPAQNYQKMPTSVLPFVAYMEDKEYLYTSVEDLKSIDMGFSLIVENLDNHHIALKFMRNKEGKPLGILTCAWKDNSITMPSEDTIKEKMNCTAAKLELLLDIK